MASRQGPSVRQTSASKQQRNSPGGGWKRLPRSFEKHVEIFEKFREQLFETLRIYYVYGKACFMYGNVYFMYGDVCFMYGL